MSETAETLLDVRELRTSYFTRRGELKAVDGASLSVRKGEIVGVVGESGCGKSALALSILRLVSRPGRVVGGSVSLAGRELLSLREREMRRARGGEIAMVFQEPMTSLNPVKTVGWQIEEAAMAHEKGLSRREAAEQAAQMLKAAGVADPERRLASYPHQLSGGLRQRAMIAMALIRRPRLLIADEPTTALDVTVEAQILGLMKELRSEFGASILLISHNLGVIAETCDRVYVMYAGKVVEESDVFSLFEGPLHPYTAGLLKSLPRADDDAPAGTRLRAIEGTVPELSRMPPGCAFAPRCELATDECARRAPPLVEAGSGRRVRCHRIGTAERT
jgi:oligopeptide/dipeptide ABC transporter, ATP-binding protein, C-terminal domain